jgi:ABC-type glycerol-3-phosphate transport system substrate-binding protein
MKASMFQIILLSIFGAFAVAGILIFAFLVGTNGGGSLGAVTMWGPYDEVAMTTIIRQLSEDDKRLRQVTYVQKNADTLEQELTNALASGTGPDLYVLRDDYSVVDSPKITSVPYESFSKEQFDELFVEAAKPFLSKDGVLAVPLSVDPLVMYWNRDLLSAAGFAKPPVYWDELFEMARVITDCQDLNVGKSTIEGCDESRSIKKATVAFGEYANVLHGKEIVGMLIKQAGGPVTVRDSGGDLVPSLMARTGEVSQPAESALNFYTTFANPARDTYSWNRSLQPSRAVFAAGDLALYVGEASEAALIRRLNPNLNFGISPMPQIRNLEKSATGGHAYGLAVPKTSKNPQGALTIAYLLASPDASKMIATVIGQASARRDVLAQGGQGNDDLFNRQALIVLTWEDPDPMQTDRIFRDMIESITSGSAKISEALQRAEQAMRQITSAP